MPNTPPDTSPDAELTHDDILLGSLSYKGYSSRYELWVFLVVMVAASFLLALLGIVGDVLLALFCIFCVWPMYVRRARQMGTVGYGYFIVGLYVLNLLIDVCCLIRGIESEPGFSGILLIFLLPLYFYRGPLSGRKTALMRAAMEGDMEQVKLLLEQKPHTLLMKSDKGHTAHEYAEFCGHAEVAAYLRAAEERAAEGEAT